MSWKKVASVGGYGYTVTVMRRRDSPILYLRWGDRWQSLEHSDRAEAIIAAKRKSAALLASRGRSRTLRLGQLLELYRDEVTPQKKRPKEDERRIDLWLHVLGAEFDPMHLTGTTLKAFERDRAAGRLSIPDRDLRAAGAKTIREDLAFLRAVFNWAASMASGWLLERNPMDGYELPREINPSRPRAYWEDYLALQDVAARVHPLFGPFMAIIESLGWRVTATCEVRVSDFDPERTETRPHGRLLKRAESDKVGLERWTTIPAAAREALVAAQGDRVGDVWLFPAERSSGPWSRHYARSLLNQAWELAKVPKARRTGFHGFRRKWVDERKHLPEADVAAQGGWLSVRTLDIYRQADEETLLAVAEEPRKLRIRAKS